MVALLIAASAYVITACGREPPAGDHSYRVLAVLPIETDGEDPADDALVRGVAETVSARIAQGTNGKLFQLIPPNELSAQGVKTADAARREFGVDLVLAVATAALRRQDAHHLQPDRSQHPSAGGRAHRHRRCGRPVRAGRQRRRRRLRHAAAGRQSRSSRRLRRSRPPCPPDTNTTYAAVAICWSTRRSENIDSAIAEFEHALQVSPNYAPAYAGLGEAYWRGYKADRGNDWLDKATINCEKALAADPEAGRRTHLPREHIQRHWASTTRRVKEFQRALLTGSRQRGRARRTGGGVRQAG